MTLFILRIKLLFYYFLLKYAFLFNFVLVLLFNFCLTRVFLCDVEGWTQELTVNEYKNSVPGYIFEVVPEEGEDLAYKKQLNNYYVEHLRDFRFLSLEKKQREIEYVLAQSLPYLDSDVDHIIRPAYEKFIDYKTQMKNMGGATLEQRIQQHAFLEVVYLILLKALLQAEYFHDKTFEAIGMIFVFLLCYTILWFAAGPAEPPEQGPEDFPY